MRKSPLRVSKIPVALFPGPFQPSAPSRLLVRLFSTLSVSPCCYVRSDFMEIGMNTVSGVLPVCERANLVLVDPCSLTRFPSSPFLSAMFYFFLFSYFPSFLTSWRHSSRYPSACSHLAQGQVEESPEGGLWLSCNWRRLFECACTDRIGCLVKPYPALERRRNSIARHQTTIDGLTGELVVYKTRRIKKN